MKCQYFEHRGFTHCGTFQFSFCSNQATATNLEAQRDLSLYPRTVACMQDLQSLDLVSCGPSHLVNQNSACQKP